MDEFYEHERLKDVAYQINNKFEIGVGTAKFTIGTGLLNIEDALGNDEFNAIATYKDGSKMVEVKQFDSWTLTFGGRPSRDYSAYTSNKYYIPIVLTKDVTILAFRGWPYGGDLPYLTLIALTEKDAKLIYNKNASIVEIKQEEGMKTIKIQTKLEEYDSCGKLCTAPVYATPGC